MPSYMIDYIWNYNPHGPEGSACMEQEIPLKVRYWVQSDEPDVNVQFDITIEEVWQGDIPLCTDADIECGWYKSDEERLYWWLMEGEYANGTPVKPAGSDLHSSGNQRPSEQKPLPTPITNSGETDL